MSERHYQPTLAGLIVIRVCYVIVALCAVLAVDEHAGIVFVVIMGVAGVWTVGMGERAVRTGGLYETTDGITNRRLLGFGCRREQWRDIDRFHNVRARVFVVRRDGSPWPLIGVAQGSRTKWDGGETRDIVTTLNERLELWQSSIGTRPPESRERPATSSGK
jgi:hypothetical protein